jgi:hypothetical protein
VVVIGVDQGAVDVQNCGRWHLSSSVSTYWYPLPHSDRQYPTGIVPFDPR